MSHRRDRMRREVGAFMKEYGRTAQGGRAEPNDRHYSRKLEPELKRLPPDELDRQLRDDEDED